MHQPIQAHLVIQNHTLLIVSNIGMVEENTLKRTEMCYLHFETSNSHSHKLH